MPFGREALDRDTGWRYVYTQVCQIFRYRRLIDRVVRVRLLSLSQAFGRQPRSCDLFINCSPPRLFGRRYWQRCRWRIRLRHMPAARATSLLEVVHGR